ncbi:uncharacterized protein LOC121405603 [Lytechinus variegatus]|uniref:uncharacterized protein LOC121405603 n=1 Tax=Lytechinus variegatus TaxID=7654 RepID=UPI001BB15E4D|nr:uncharacterized protein LOC121405603 [Lytechinus variegatus]XP_041452469.1 uncharacterized protein LOC121405603 [Lytechinus variegatus]
MHGSEPFLSDLGLVPVATGERDASLHLYRRNSCHQERLHQDLQRLRHQQEQVLRRANREIIDLNLEQKKRRENLNRTRRRSECLGTLRHPDSTHGDHHPFSRYHSSSQSSIHRTTSRSPSSPTSSTSGSFPRRRASIDTPTSLPPLPRATTTIEASNSSPVERPKSRSPEQLHSSSSTSMTTKSSASIHEIYMDSKSKKDFTRLKKLSDRWRNAAQQVTNVDRTGKPPIPTSSFAGSSTGKDHEVHKTSKVFDRLSMNTKATAMSSDNFLKVLKHKYKTRDAPSKT